jgi:hypothetical protein
MGNKENVSTLMIRLGCFQSFIKRVVKRLRVTFIIRPVSLFRTISSIGVCDKRFPPCLPAGRYKAFSASQSDHPVEILIMRDL